jgi:hypothetical protein
MAFYDVVTQIRRSLAPIMESSNKTAKKPSQMRAMAKLFKLPVPRRTRPSTPSESSDQPKWLPNKPTREDSDTSSAESLRSYQLPASSSSSMPILKPQTSSSTVSLPFHQGLEPRVLPKMASSVKDRLDKLVTPTFSELPPRAPPPSGVLATGRPVRNISSTSHDLKSHEIYV